MSLKFFRCGTVIHLKEGKKTNMKTNVLALKDTLKKHVKDKKINPRNGLNDHTWRQSSNIIK